MLSVANKIDSALQFDFSVSRMGLLVIKLLASGDDKGVHKNGIFVDSFINPRTGSKSISVLMSLGMSI